jgi:ribosomal protein S18 acetylase RimI-like enzyme
MSSAARPTATHWSPANVEIMPISRTHLAGFHAALDSVAKERRYLAMLEAPSYSRTRRLVLDSLRAGAVHVVAVAEGTVIGWCDLRPKAAPTLRHSAVLGMGIIASCRGQGIGSRLLASALELALARGIHRAELIVRADNTAAIRLYRRFEFVEEGICRHYLRVDGVDYDALLMARLDPGSGPAGSGW